MMIDFTDKNFILNQVLWLGISIAISLAISFAIPFPYSLPYILVVSSPKLLQEAETETNFFYKIIPPANWFYNFIFFILVISDN